MKENVDFHHYLPFFVNFSYFCLGLFSKVTTESDVYVIMGKKLKDDFWVNPDVVRVLKRRRI